MDLPDFQLRTLAIHDLSLKVELQPRASTDAKTVKQYADDMARGVEYDPIEVVQIDADTLVVTDGHHRVLAKKQAAMVKVEARVYQGDMDLARLLAARANAKHGMRRRREDVQHQIELVLESAEGRKWSNNQIAKWIGVSHTTINSARATIQKRPSEDASGVSLEKLSSEDDEPTTRTYRTKHGTVAEMDVSNIGKTRQPDPDPDPEPAMTDPFGREIDAALQPAFLAGEDLREIGYKIDGIRRDVERALQGPAGAMLDSTLTKQIRGIKTQVVKGAVPYAVCPMHPNCKEIGCRICGGRGWITQYQFDTPGVVPDRLKDKMRGDG